MAQPFYGVARHALRLAGSSRTAGVLAPATSADLELVAPPATVTFDAPAPTAVALWPSRVYRTPPPETVFVSTSRFYTATVASADLTLVAPPATVTFDAPAPAVTTAVSLTVPAAGLVTFDAAAPSAVVLWPAAIYRVPQKPPLIERARIVTVPTATVDVTIPSPAALVTFDAPAPTVTASVSLTSPAALVTFDAAVPSVLIVLYAYVTRAIQRLFVRKPSEIITPPAASVDVTIPAPAATVTFSAAAPAATSAVSLTSPASLVTFSAATPAILSAISLTSPAALVTFSMPPTGLSKSTTFTAGLVTFSMPAPTVSATGAVVANVAATVVITDTITQATVVQSSNGVTVTTADLTVNITAVSDTTQANAVSGNGAGADVTVITS